MEIIENNTIKTIYNEDFFVDINQIPQNMIHFSKLVARVSRARLTTGKLIIKTSGIYNKKSKHSNISIYEKDFETNKYNKIATFYNWYNYTHGMRALFENH